MAHNYITLVDNEFCSLVLKLFEQQQFNWIENAKETKDSTQYVDIVQKLPNGNQIKFKRFEGYFFWLSKPMDSHVVFYVLRQQGGGIWLSQNENEHTLFLMMGHLCVKICLSDIGLKHLNALMHQLLIEDSKIEKNLTFSKLMHSIEDLRLKSTVKWGKSLVNRLNLSLINDTKRVSKRQNHALETLFSWLKSNEVDDFRWDLCLSVGRLYEAFLPFRSLFITETDWVWMTKDVVMQLELFQLLNDEELMSLLEFYSPSTCPPAFIFNKPNDNELNALQRRIDNLLPSKHLVHRLKKGASLWINWDGGRKSSGSYYTPPSLAYATVVKAIEPLVFELDPKSILEIKLCDPSLGAAMFLTCSKRYLAQQLLESIVHHNIPWSEFLDSHCVEKEESNNSNFVLVAERLIERYCLHGVDLNEAAIHLSKWILPDAHLVHGNALIGTLFSDVSNCHPSGKYDGLSPLLDAFPFLDRTKHTVKTNDQTEGIYPLNWPQSFPQVTVGFDVIVGNPPWESHKPSVRSFFERIDPALRFLSRQRANKRIKHLLSQSSLKRDWNNEQAHYKYRSNYFKNVGQIRNGPFRLQGTGDANLWKLFLELSHNLLCDGGVLAFVLPGNLVSDRGASPLRRMLLNKSSWRWLFGFWNERRIFDIDSTYRFAVVIADKSIQSNPIKSRFFVSDSDEWTTNKPKYLEIDPLLIQRFSPKHMVILSFDSQDEIDLWSKISLNAILLSDVEGLKFRSGIHMTAMADKIHPAHWWEDQGFRLEMDGRFLHSGGREALPLYEGRMLDRFDGCAKAWVSGRGRHSIWTKVQWSNKQIKPQFWIDKKHVPPVQCKPRIGFKSISRPTIKRTMSAAYLNQYPSGNAIAGLWHSDESTRWVLLTLMNSLVFDYMIKRRCSGLNINWHVLEESLIPTRAFQGQLSTMLSKWSKRLSCFLPHLDSTQIEAQQVIIDVGLRRRVELSFDVLITHAYGLNLDDLRLICRDCHHSVFDLNNRSFRQTLDPKGFWRIDKNLEPSLRYTNQLMDEYGVFIDAVQKNENIALASLEERLNHYIRNSLIP